MAFHRARKVVKVDAHKVKGANALFGQGLHVLGLVLVGKNTRVNLGVQGLDPATQNFGESRHGAYCGNGQTGRLKGLLCAAGRDKLYPPRGKKRGKLHKAALVRNAQNSATNGQNIHKRLLEKCPG